MQPLIQSAGFQLALSDPQGAREREITQLASLAQMKADHDLVRIAAENFIAS